MREICKVDTNKKVPDYDVEGSKFSKWTNHDKISSLENLEEARLGKEILEGMVYSCDSKHNLHIELGNGLIGLLPKYDAGIGVINEESKDISIISKVGKPVCFRVQDITEDGTVVLTRRSLQEEYLEYFLNTFVAGDIIKAKVTRFESYGCFVDIGCGVSALLPIEYISVSRIKHPSDRFDIGQVIKVVVRKIDYDLKRVTVSHKELLGTWEQGVQEMEVGSLVTGVVRGIEEYGIFIELTPNISGLSELSECMELISVGQKVTVVIKSICPEKMKVKLYLVEAFYDKIVRKIQDKDYFITEGHIDEWVYNTDICPKETRTIFRED